MAEDDSWPMGGASGLGPIIVDVVRSSHWSSLFVLWYSGSISVSVSVCVCADDGDGDGVLIFCASDSDLCVCFCLAGAGLFLKGD